MSAVARDTLAAEHGERARVLDGSPLRALEQDGGSVRRRGWLVRRMLLGADLLGLSIAFLAAQLATTDGAGGIDRHWEGVLFFATTLPAWVLAGKIAGLYDRDEERASTTTTDDLGGVFHLVTLGVWLFFVGAKLTGLADPQLGRLIAFWVLAVALVTGARSGARAICRRRHEYVQNTVIVGAGEVGQLIARKIRQHPEYGLNLVGFVDSHPLDRPSDLDSVPLLGAASGLPDLVGALDLDRVIIAFSPDPHRSGLDLLRRLRELDVQVDVVPRFFEVVSPGVSLHSVEGLAVMSLPPVRLPRSSRLLKRAMDVFLSLAGLVLLAPLFAVIAAAVKLDSPGPVFFRQVRMGTGERTFTIAKFRTMAADADTRKDEVRHLNRHLDHGDPRMFKIPSDPRVTWVGRMLRRFSLDELPQLWNVLRGDMSLVGPRPLILDEDRHVESWGRRRLDLRPGITGLWQVLGRSEIPFEEMVRLDYVYVTSWSLLGDLKILLRTIPALRGAPGAY